MKLVDGAQYVDEATAEMKRLRVTPAGRGQQLGTIPGGFRMSDGVYADICPYYKELA